MGTKAHPDRALKSCGERHAYCKKCRPDVDTSRMTRRQPHRNGCACPMHKSQMGPKNPNWKGGLGYNWDGNGWRKAREAVWTRDKRCRLCGELPSSKRRLDVHHIVSRREGGANELNNLVGLHHGCHMRVHLGTKTLVVKSDITYGFEP